jgi:hypothetical protein
MKSGQGDFTKPAGQYWVVTRGQPANIARMDQPEPNATTAENARRARRLLVLLMVVFILLPWLVLMLRR